MPKKVHGIEKGDLDQNEFQKRSKPADKLQQKQLAKAKRLELVLREANEGRMFDRIFAMTEAEQMRWEEVARSAAKSVSIMKG